MIGRYQQTGAETHGHPAKQVSVADAPSPYATCVLKRLMDLLLGAVLAVLTLPVVVVVAGGSLISFRAWPFFTQERIGRGGTSFRLIKVRSLPINTPSYADKYRIDSVVNTRWGIKLRSSHLDELPQLWLVVTGKMSLVGPRPEMRSVAAWFTKDFIECRSQVRPGCTGAWQVGPHATGLIGENPRYDILYVRHASLRIDLRILAATGRLLFGGPPLQFDNLVRTAEARSPVTLATSRVLRTSEEMSCTIDKT